MKVLTIFCLFVIALKNVDGETCPSVPFQANFQPKKFLGKWNVIQTSGVDIPCANYIVEESPGIFTYKVALLPANLNVELSPKKARDLSEGFIEKSPLPLLNNANLRVFDTDYENYAGIVECNDSNGVFYVSVTFASRKKTLSDETINNMKKKLIGYGIDVSGLKVVNHSGCV